MKKLEVNQLEVLEGGSDRDCSDVGGGFMVGATVAGAAVGGPIGLMVGGIFGLLVGTFITISGACNIEIF